MYTTDYDCDHQAVIINIKINSDSILRTPKTIPNFSNVNWRTFNSTLESRLEILAFPNNSNLQLDNQQIDLFIDNLNSIVYDIMWKHTSLKPR